ncbi:MAG TPA: hypothetical protein VMB91_13635 [Solirubrobacteraceae bacterium]|nr:hypothetical protein [Solirubrobacteraceae bacterium]
MDRRSDTCSICGGNDWAEATDETYARQTDRMREKTGVLRVPDGLLVCQKCGAMRVTLSTMFHTGRPVP